MSAAEFGPDSPSPLRERIRLALHVLRGRPLAYRIHVGGGGLVVDRPHTWLIRNCVKADGAAVAFEADMWHPWEWTP